MVKLYREKIAFRGSYRCKFKSAAELGPAQLVCFIRLELVRAPVTTFVSTFLANVLKQLLTTFSISISYTSHMLAKVLSKKETHLLRCWIPDACLHANVFPHEVWLVTDLRVVKADQQQLTLQYQFTVKDQSFIQNAQASTTRRKLLASQLSHFQSLLARDGHPFRDRDYTFLRDWNKRSF